MPNDQIDRSWKSHQQDCVDASVKLWRVCHLRVFSPYDLAALRHEAEVADIDLQHRTLRHDTQLRSKKGTNKSIHTSKPIGDTIRLPDMCFQSNTQTQEFLTRPIAIGRSNVTHLKSQYRITRSYACMATLLFVFPRELLSGMTVLANPLKAHGPLICYKCGPST